MKRLGLAASVSLTLAVVLQPSSAHAASGALLTADATAYEARLEAAKSAMMSDPESALAIVRSTRPLTDRIPVGSRRSLVQAKAQWLEGEALGRMGALEEASRVLDNGLRVARTQANGSKLHGDLIMSAAATDGDLGRVQRALQGYQEAFRIFQRLGEKRSQAIALQNIGALYSNAGDFPRVLRYYAQSAEIYQDDPAVLLSALNNIATALKDMGKLSEAEAEYGKALRIARHMQSASLEARVLNNIAATQLRAGDLARAERTAREGLRRASGSSGAEWAPFLWGVRGQIAYRRGDLNGAAVLLERAFAGTDLAQTGPFHRDFHETAENVYAALGQTERAFAHLQALKRLDDEMREIRSSTNSALMAAQFDFSNQELKISRLKAGQLERDITIARAKARTQRLLMIGAILALGIMLVAHFSIRRSRNETRAANRSLNSANSALQKALKAKSEFLATTSHEIRTPLNGILGMTQVLLRNRRLPADTREQVQVVQGAGEMMKAVVDDILDMAKIESGRLAIEPGEVALPALLRDAARIWVEQAESKGLVVREVIDGAPPLVIADERRLRQVVFNLMSNAAKFTEAGEIRLECCVREEDGGETLEIVVRDTGIGIAAQDQQAIFEPFHQVDGGTTRRFGGTGLGLSISRNLVVAMGGTISVQSEPGVGSVFTVCLPLVRASAAGPTAQEAMRPDALDACRILLLEPNPLFQSITRASIEASVGLLRMVEDADELRDALTGGWDLIVADAGALPGDPDALFSDIRLTTAAPILLLAADPVALAGCTADRVAAKAFPPIDLVDVMADVLALPLSVTPPEREAA